MAVNINTRRSTRKRNSPSYYFNDSVPSPKLEKTKNIKSNSNKFYECEIVEVNSVEKQMKIHFVGYSEKYDEWKPYSDKDFPVVRKIAAYECCNESLVDRCELLKSGLGIAVKKSLQSGRKDDPNIRLEVNTQNDSFLELFNNIAISKNQRGKAVYRAANHEISAILGHNWDHRIINCNMDFNFVINDSVEFWLSEKLPITEYKFIGGKLFKQLIDQHPALVFNFVRGRGNKATFNNWLNARKSVA